MQRELEKLRKQHDIEVDEMHEMEEHMSEMEKKVVPPSISLFFISCPQAMYFLTDMKSFSIVSCEKKKEKVAFLPENLPGHS